MQLGMIGLGRMDANIVRRAIGRDHKCVAYNHDPQAVKALAGEGATGVESVAELATKLAAPRMARTLLRPMTQRKETG